MYERIKKIYWDLGYSGVSAFIAEAVRSKLATAEFKHLEVLENRIKEKQRRVDLSATEREITDH